MPIIVNIDVMLARRKMSSGELAEKIGISATNLSILKTGKAKAIRFRTLTAICKAHEKGSGPCGSGALMFMLSAYLKSFNMPETEDAISAAFCICERSVF